MRICDRKGCHERHAKTILEVGEGQEYDLCSGHYNEFREHINQPEKVFEEAVKSVKKKKKKKK